MCVSYSFSCFLPSSICSLLCYESKRWIGVVGIQLACVCVMNESCLPRERLQKSIKVGIAVGGRWMGRSSLRNEGRKNG